MNRDAENLRLGEELQPVHKAATLRRIAGREQRFLLVISAVTLAVQAPIPLTILTNEFDLGPRQSRNCATSRSTNRANRSRKPRANWAPMRTKSSSWPRMRIRSARRQSARGDARGARERASLSGWRRFLFARSAGRTKLGVTRDNLILGNGSNEVIEFLGHAFLNRGDEIITSRARIYRLQIDRRNFRRANDRSAQPGLSPRFAGDDRRDHAADCV